MLLNFIAGRTVRVEKCIILMPKLQCHTTEYKTEADSQFDRANCNILFGVVCTNLTIAEHELSNCFFNNRQIKAVILSLTFCWLLSFYSCNCSVFCSFALPLYLFWLLVVGLKREKFKARTFYFHFVMYNFLVYLLKC